MLAYSYTAVQPLTVPMNLHDRDHGGRRQPSIPKGRIRRRPRQRGSSERRETRAAAAATAAPRLLLVLLPLVVVVLCSGTPCVCHKATARAAALLAPASRKLRSGNAHRVAWDRRSLLPRAATAPAAALVYTRGQRWALPANTLPSIGDGQQEDGGRQGAGGIGIGIDLGTTYSAVAYLRDGRVPTIVPVDGERTLPSVVQFLSRAGEGNSIVTGSDDDHEDDDRDGRVVVVGRRACSSLDAYRNFKRVIGTGGRIPRDVAAVVPHLLPNSASGSTHRKNTLANQLDDAVRFPTLLAGSGSDPSVRAAIKPEVLSGFVLKKLKRAAESHTGQKVTRAVVGVPAYFNDAQREATIRAAGLAGIGKVKLLREPEAAALAYRNFSHAAASSLSADGDSEDGDGDPGDELVLVFDLGGGTYDVSALALDGDLCTVLCTSGDARLGGTNWDERIARHLLQVLGDQRERGEPSAGARNWSPAARNSVLLAAERIRIHLSNSRTAKLALPRTEEAWEELANPQSVLLPASPQPQGDEGASSSSSPPPGRNATHVFATLSRREMESLCREEFQALLRPLREVAVMAGALLPGDASPALVDAALGAEAAFLEGEARFEDFYPDEDAAASRDAGDASSSLLRLELEESMTMRLAKKSQQRGRKKARDVAKQERRFRAEKRKLVPTLADAEKSAKIRDGISGRPISRVVLVGGATRMPGVGRLLAALTGVAPQRTVNPDEAVALGCAVHAGVLDGSREFGKVLNPMQAAILRAMAEQAQRRRFDDDDDDDF